SGIEEGELDDFTAFLYARHALEVYRKRPKMNPGIAREDAQYEVDEVKKDAEKFKRFTKSADAVTGYSDSMLAMLVDAGVITQQSAEKMMAAWDTYIPLARAMEPKKGFVRNLGG